MKPRDEKMLLRRLLGEVSESALAEIDQRLRDEAELASRNGELERAWERLDLPDVEAAPAGFASGVLRRVRDERSGFLRWRSGRLPARLAAAGALAGGVILGVLLVNETGEAANPVLAEDPFLMEESTLVDSYWAALDEVLGTALVEGEETP